MDTQEIRLATPQDAVVMHELHTSSVRVLCKDVYSQETIEGWLANRSPSGYIGIRKNEMYVLEQSGNIVGFSHVVPGEILAIFVDPDYIRQGIGSALVKHGLTKAKEDHIGPIRIDSTLNAQPFYESLGFRMTGQRTVQRNDVDIPIIEMETYET